MILSNRVARRASRYSEGEASSIRVEPDLNRFFARKGVNLEQTVPVNDMYGAGGGVPDVKVFVSQECLDIILRDRT